MSTDLHIKLFFYPGGGRVIAQTLSEAPLRFVKSIGGKFAVAWRTYAVGRPHQDDGKLWLLEYVQQDEYIVRLERSVFYANSVSVSDNGSIAWIRADKHRGPVHDFEVIDIDGEYLIEGERLPCSTDVIAFSESGNTVAILQPDIAPSKQRAFVWHATSGRNVAAFALLLTDGANKLKVTEDTFSLITYNETQADYAFDGTIIYDNRFDEIKGYSFLWYLRASIDQLPTDQLCYTLNSLNTLIQSSSFKLAQKTDREHVQSIRHNIIKMLGESSNMETSLTINVQNELWGRLNECAISGLFGSDVDSVANNLLSRALDFVQVK